MDLIKFQGLNCYQCCVVSIAHHLGVSYPLAFSTLWSETDFLYEDYFQIYSSKRMVQNLEALGVRILSKPPEPQEQVRTRLSMLPVGALAVAGMDAFAIPWSPIYMLAHENHFFIIQKVADCAFSCFDPSYGEKDARMTCADFLPYIFDLRSADPMEKHPIRTTAIQEAKCVVQAHPGAMHKMVERIQSASAKEEFLMVGRYIDAMIINRYLYRHYLDPAPLAGGLWSDDYFLRWKSVKNGLFKASFIKEKTKIIAEVISRFQDLMNEELEMAAAMVMA